MSGLPPSSRNCLGNGRPMRLPTPPASTTMPIFMRSSLAAESSGALPCRSPGLIIGRMSDPTPGGLDRARLDPLGARPGHRRGARWPPAATIDPRLSRPPPRRSRHDLLADARDDRGRPADPPLQRHERSGPRPARAGPLDAGRAGHAPAPGAIDPTDGHRAVPAHGPAAHRDAGPRCRRRARSRSTWRSTTRSAASPTRRRPSGSGCGPTDRRPVASGRLPDCWSGRPACSTAAGAASVLFASALISEHVGQPGGRPRPDGRTRPRPRPRPGRRCSSRGPASSAGCSGGCGWRARWPGPRSSSSTTPIRRCTGSGSGRPSGSSSCGTRRVRSRPSATAGSGRRPTPTGSRGSTRTTPPRSSAPPTTSRSTPRRSGSRRSG